MEPFTAPASNGPLKERETTKPIPEDGDYFLAAVPVKTTILILAQQLYSSLVVPPYHRSTAIMRNPEDLGSRPTKISDKLRGLTRLVHAPEKSTEKDAFTPVHAPDRPPCPLNSKNIPDDEECRALLEEQWHRVEPERQFHAQQEETLAAHGRIGTPPPRIRLIGHTSVFEDMPDDERWLNPRKAPTPRPRDGGQHGRAGSLPPAVKPKIPRMPKGSRSVVGQARTYHQRFASLPGQAMLPPQPPGAPDEPYEEAVSPFKACRPQSNTWSTCARVGVADDRDTLLLPTSSPNRTTQQTASGLGLDPRCCRMPGCNIIVTRTTSGFCDACEFNFVTRPDTVRHNFARKMASMSEVLPETVSHQLGSASGADEAGSLEENEHFARQVKITTPPESPRKIALGSSPTKSSTGTSMTLPLRQAQTSGDTILQRFVEMPEDMTVSGSRGGIVPSTAVAYLKQISRYHQRAQDLRQQKSLVLGFSDAEAAAKEVVIDEGLADHESQVASVEWPESSYYFDDENFAREDEDGKLSPCCQGIKEEREREIPHALGLRELRSAMCKEKDSSDDDSDESISPILSGMRSPGCT